MIVQARCTECQSIFDMRGPLDDGDKLKCVKCKGSFAYQQLDFGLTCSECEADVFVKGWRGKKVKCPECDAVNFIDQEAQPVDPETVARAAPPPPPPKPPFKFEWRPMAPYLVLGALLLVAGGWYLFDLLTTRPRGSVSGTVTYVGKPLRSGSVVLVGEDGAPISAAIGADGTYAAKGVPYGKVRIAVQSQDPSTIQLPTPKPAPPGTAMSSEPARPKAVDATGWFAIPDPYADVTQSGLTVNVRAQSTPHNIELR